MSTTWNPSDKDAGITLVDNNFGAEKTVWSDWGYQSVRATQSFSSGKWYWEIQHGPQYGSVGIATSSVVLSTAIGADAEGYSFRCDGNKYNNGSGVAYGDNWCNAGVGPLISIALDLDNGKIWFALDGIWQNSGDPAAGTGEAFSGLSGIFFPAMSKGYGQGIFTVNFGKTSFVETIPNGFNAIDVSNSVPLTIPSSLIDEELLDFPIAIDLATQAPIIFSELQNNNKKLKVTCADSYEKLLIHSDTIDGSTIFVDSSDNEHVVNFTGNVHHEIDQKKFGDTSIYFDGTSDASLSIVDSPDFDFGIGDFAIDFWVNYSSAAQYQVLFEHGYLATGGLIINTSDQASPIPLVYISGILVLTGSAISTGVWEHIALTRSGTDLRLFQGGIVIDSGTNSDNITSILNPFIGLRGSNGTWAFNGYIDEFRISKGIARWTSNFTPPIQPYGQCFVEIENWDVANSKGVLHTKIPAIKSDVDTVITLEWEDFWDDNTDYVGDTGSVPAKQVWDDNFVAVYHMAQDPSIGGACILDSTNLANHGTPVGITSSDQLVDGDMGKALFFSGEFGINCGSDVSFDFPNDFTLESLVQESNTNEYRIIYRYDGSHDGYCLGYNGGKLATIMWPDYGTHLYVDGVSINNVYEHFVAQVISGNGKMFVDGSVQINTHAITAKDGGVLYLAQDLGGGHRLHGKIAETRLSKISRSDAWIKATNASLKGTLFDVEILRNIIHILKAVQVINSNNYLVLGGI